MNSMYEKVKRVMDVCLSFVCLVAFTPGFIVIAAIICRKHRAVLFMYKKESD